MAIRFAGARIDGTSPIRAWRCRSAPMCAINDNTSERLHDATLIATLRHFARHGLAAAEHAGARALSARGVDDRQACLHWLSVCRQLDRRLAERVGEQLGDFAA
jgi:hypothetical protein